MTQKNIPEKIKGRMIKMEDFDVVEIGGIENKINEIIDFLTPEVKEEERVTIPEVYAYKAGQKDERERVRGKIEEILSLHKRGYRVDQELNDLISEIGE